MWQCFTERARRVILLGQEEALKLNAAHVGTEHLLLGLLREEEGVAAQLLAGRGVDFVCARKLILEETGADAVEGDPPSVDPKLTPKAKRVLELSADEARRMRHNYIGTEHLLLGLLREEKGIAAKVLESCGLDLDAMRPEVAGYLGPDEDDEAARKPSAPQQAAAPRKVRAQTDYNFHAAPGLQALLIAAGAEAILSGHQETHTEHVLLALFNSAHPLADWLQELGVDSQHAADSLRECLQSTLPPVERVAGPEELVELYVQKNAAIARDYYEAAANLRDEIRMLRNQLQADDPKPAQPEENDA